MKSQRRKRIMDDAKVKAMSKEYGVSVERIREIEVMALDRLASLASSWPSRGRTPGTSCSSSRRSTSCCSS